MRIVSAKLVEFKGVVPLELIGAMYSPTVPPCPTPKPIRVKLESKLNNTVNRFRFLV